MSEFELTNAWARVRRVLDRQRADAVLSKHGGNPGQPGSVPEDRVEDCVAALKALAAFNDDDGDDDNGFAPTKAKPQTLDDIRVGAFARFNNPPTMRKRGG